MRSGTSARERPRRVSGGSTKKVARSRRETMRREYDFASMSGGVRGKYAARLRSGTNLVLLEEDVAQAFPTAAAVNEALRAVLQAAACVSRRRKPPAGRRPRPAAS